MKFVEKSFHLGLWYCRDSCLPPVSFSSFCSRKKDERELMYTHTCQQSKFEEDDTDTTEYTKAPYSTITHNFPFTFSTALPKRLLHVSITPSRCKASATQKVLWDLFTILASRSKMIE